MLEEKRTRVPERKREGLVVQKLDEEVLVYDLERHKAHCLNQTAAMIWEMCDGKRTVKEIAADMKRVVSEGVDEDIVWEAIKQLNKNNLLINRIAKPTDGMSRRELIKRIGIGAAIALPLVTSIAAPTAAQAQSCQTSGKCGPGFPACCSGFVCTDVLSPGTCTCQPNGTPVTGNCT